MSAKGKFGVFSLASLETPWSTSAGVDDTGKVVRQRHYHRKSRKGCTRCKARKVKCDEKRPTCGKCSMRGEECVFEPVDDVLGELTMRRASHASQELSSEQPFAAPGIRSVGRSADIPHIGAATEELMPLRLMHHFEHFTSGTLLFGKHFWRGRILPLALHHDFLMHAVLTLSASHLSYFLPHLSGTKRAMNIHLSHTLPGFRNGVGRITSSQDSDAIIACGILLLYYAWSVPFFNQIDDSSFKVSSDGLLWFATGLQEVITTAYEAQRHGTVPGGIFANIAIPQYMQILSDIRTRTGSTGRSYNFAEKFLGLQQLPSIEVQRACRETKLESRLDPIFYAVDSLTVGLDMTEILPSFRTYSLTWPSKAPKEFINQVERAEPHALLILLSFYACVGLMLSEDAWWARRRCKVMCEAILSQLTCSSWSENVTHIARYFRFNQNENGSWEIGSSWVGMMRNLEDEE